jgi:hypothetical protein
MAATSERQNRGRRSRGHGRPGCRMTGCPGNGRRRREMRALRREGGLGTPRRGEVLPRLLGQEDRRRGDRRAEFALKRYIRAHSAEKYLIYHSTLKRPCGQIIVVDDGYDLFLTMVLYPTFGGTKRPTTSRAIPKAAASPRFSSTWWPPRSSSPGAAASGTWRSSDRPAPRRRTGTARCNPASGFSRSRSRRWL